MGGYPILPGLVIIDKMSRPRLGEMLVERKLITPAQLNRALHEQQRWGGVLGNYLVTMDIIDEKTLIEVIAEQLKLPWIDLTHTFVDPEAASLLPLDVCERYGLIAFRTDDARRFLDVAMSDPMSTDAHDVVRTRTRLNVRQYVAGPRAIAHAINVTFYGGVEEWPRYVPEGPPPEDLPPSPFLAESERLPAGQTDRPGPPSATIEAMARAADPVRGGQMPGARDEGERVDAPAELVAERMHRLEVAVRRTERMMRLLIEHLAREGQLDYPRFAARMGTTADHSGIIEIGDINKILDAQDEEPKA